MSAVYLSLGSNEGDRKKNLEQAIEAIDKTIGTVTARSSIYRTAAWGLEDQPEFLNMAIAISTHLLPEELLNTVQHTEKSLGRIRTIRWGQRIIDIDILLYNDEVIKTPWLEIPHPRMWERLFVLMPLHEIAPDIAHPALNKTVAQLLADCPDKLEVSVYEGEN